MTSHKHRKHCSVMVKVPDCYASAPGSILGQVSEIFVNLCYFVELV